MTATDSFQVFGTTALLAVTEAAALAPARAIADAELAAVDRASSRFREHSELSRLNRARGQLTTVSNLFATLIAEAVRAAELTGGNVDLTCGQALVSVGYDRDFGELRSGAAATAPAAAHVPGWRCVELDPAVPAVRLARGAQIDLGATAKAWAADRCAREIADQLACGVLVSLGGDVADAPGQTVVITSGGLATSSTTVRMWTAGSATMHHIIDPKTGQPARSVWRTVSVAAATCVDANIASTAAIIRSEAAPEWLAASGLPARLVRRDGTVHTTPGWPSPSQ
jgi:FAD:protein FMN transferase